jgi:anti-anti-sigma factor
MLLDNKWMVPMEISYRDLRDHKIIMLKGEMDYCSSRELKDAIYKLIHDKTKSIVLDLKDVTFIDSAGMGLLINVNKKLNNYNGKIGLLNLSEDILNLIKLATLDKIIQIYHNEDDIK